MKTPFEQRIYHDIPSALPAEYNQIGLQIDIRGTGAWK